MSKRGCLEISRDPSVENLISPELGTGEAEGVECVRIEDSDDHERAKPMTGAAEEGS